MNTKAINSLIETVFFGGEGGGLEDEPKPRFKWTPPGGAAPGGEDLGNLDDYAEMDIPPRGGLKSHAAPTPPGAPVPPPPAEPDEMDDRTGKFSMKDMLPKEEVASSDDLIDFFSKIRAAKGKKKKAWQKEFDAHRTEFESMISRFVDNLLTEAVCDECGQEVGDRFFADRTPSGKKTTICGSCYMKKGTEGQGHGPDSYDAPEYTGTGRLPYR